MNRLDLSAAEAKAERFLSSTRFESDPSYSPDGKRIVWGSTEARTWDVMVADFVSDASGMRLESPRRVVHDTTWWETHGFTPDGRRVITTNTRAGMLATDITTTLVHPHDPHADLFDELEATLQLVGTAQRPLQVIRVTLVNEGPAAPSGLTRPVADAAVVPAGVVVQ